MKSVLSMVAAFFAAVAILSWGASAQALSPRYSDNGAVVRWSGEPVEFVLDESLKKAHRDALDVAPLALEAWRESGPHAPTLTARQADKRTVGFSEDGANENVVVFSKKGWEPAKGALAVTVLTYLSETGQILDADIVVNGGKNEFTVYSTDDPDLSTKKGDAYDFLNVLTHETGHALGLPEEQVEKKATMYTHSKPGETLKRTLHTTDRSAAREVYASQFDAELAEESGVGCGSRVARGFWSRTAWGAQLVLVGALGLIALTLLRRRTNRDAVMGGGFAVVAAGILVVPPAVNQPSLELGPTPRAAPDAELTVLAAKSAWRDGVLVTRLQARVETCLVARCSDRPLEIEVLGGRIGDVTQIVGGEEVPDVGMRVAARLAESGWKEVLTPRP